MNIAIVKAGGVGLRLGSKIPKQFLTVYDKPLLVYTLERMQNMAKIDQIIVPTLENWIPVVESYVAEYGLTKVKHKLKDIFIKNIDTAVSINDVMIDQGIKLHIVDGDWKNFKITTKDDLELFKHLIGQQLL